MRRTAPNLAILLLALLYLTTGCSASPALPTRAATAAPPRSETAATLTPAPPPATPALEVASLEATATAPAGETTATPVAVVTIAPSLTATITPPVPGPEVPTLTPTPTATPCASPGRIETGLLPSAIAGEFAYRVYLPPCYSSDGRAYPTLTMMGGNIHDDRIWDRLGLDEAAEAAILAGAIPPLIIVMPDAGPTANSTSGGPWSYEGLIVNELIPHIEQRYCAWAEADGRAIGGLSRGGYWSLEIAFRHAAQFASVGGHSYALLDSHAGPDMDPRYTGVTNDLGDLRIFLDIGSADYLLPQAQELHDRLTEAGVAHEWHLNEGNHEDAYWMAHLNDYLTWYSAGWPADRSLLPACSGR